MVDSEDLNLEDYLKMFSCDSVQKQIETEIGSEQYYCEVINAEPIGRLMFYKYCINVYSECTEFLLLINSLCSKPMEIIENREKLLANLIRLKRKFEEQNSFEILQDLMKKLITELEKSFDEKKIRKFCKKGYDCLNVTLFDDFIDTIYFDRYLQFKALEVCAASEKAYHKFEILSSGSFAVVYSCESVITNTKFACKCFNKNVIAKKKHEEYVRREKNIMKMLDSRFVLDLFCTYETEHHICMITTFMSGGDLAHHIRNKGNGFAIETVKIYAAEITCGLLYLHSKNIVHFDLKPKNILLDSRGHLRIGDLGLARVLKTEKKIHVIPGTKYYIAPEVLQMDVVGPAADWFSFGCVLYEMIEGVNPIKCLKYAYPEKSWIFLARKEREIYTDNFNQRAKVLCRKLLDKNPKDRMEIFVCRNWSEKMKRDPFFDNIDWRRLETGSIEVPFVPNVNEKHHDEFFNSSVFDSSSVCDPGCTSLHFRPKIETGVQSLHWQLDLINSSFCNRMTTDMNFEYKKKNFIINNNNNNKSLKVKNKILFK